MAIQAGTYQLGPDNADLRVKTGRGGAAAKAGHDLTIGVTSWNATLTVGDSSSLELNADSSSLEVLAGEGGVNKLGDDDKTDIKKSIDNDILKKKDIQFRSSEITTTDTGLKVDGELTLVGNSQPASFDVSVGDDGALSASTTVTQSDFGIKPYSALFGALKVTDDVEVSIEGKIS
jgi:polyisoprenoid-binding protein YceI